jgi:hypothetical protein
MGFGAEVGQRVDVAVSEGLGGPGVEGGVSA